MVSLSVRSIDYLIANKELPFRQDWHADDDSCIRASAPFPVLYPGIENRATQSRAGFEQVWQDFGISLRMGGHWLRASNPAS